VTLTVDYWVPSTLIGRLTEVIVVKLNDKEADLVQIPSNKIRRELTTPVLFFILSEVNLSRGDGESVHPALPRFNKLLCSFRIDNSVLPPLEDREQLEKRQNPIIEWSVGMVTVNKATLKNFDSGNYTATIEIAGSGKTYLEGVLVAGQSTSGRNVSRQETGRDSL